RKMTQEAAMFRAFALGVDAALGQTHEGELEALQREHHRGLVQIAFDEGQTRARETLRERGGSTGSPNGSGFEPGDPEWDVWEDLIVETESDTEAFEAVDVPRSRLDLPDALDKPGFLDRPGASDDRITLPRFILR
ncbi:MAG: hypothetical protein KGY43_08340, partial [Halodesulfurarchaeum sp.]|nr:hypothetical protein [Halodesulfurarchaeum sp.]